MQRYHGSLKLGTCPGKGGYQLVGHPSRRAGKIAPFGVVPPHWGLPVGARWVHQIRSRSCSRVAFESSPPSVHCSWLAPRTATKAPRCRARARMARRRAPKSRRKDRTRTRRRCLLHRSPMVRRSRHRRPREERGEASWVPWCPMAARLRPVAVQTEEWRALAELSPCRQAAADKRRMVALQVWERLVPLAKATRPSRFRRS